MPSLVSSRWRFPPFGGLKNCHSPKCLDASAGTCLSSLNRRRVQARKKEQQQLHRPLKPACTNLTRDWTRVGPGLRAAGFVLGGVWARAGGARVDSGTPVPSLWEPSEFSLLRKAGAMSGPLPEHPRRVQPCEETARERR